MKFIYANLKTNFNFEEISAYFKELSKVVEPTTNLKHNNFVIYLNALYTLTISHQYKDLSSYVGIQSFDLNKKGSFTSTVSYEQVFQDGIKNVLIGHSEELKIKKISLEQINWQLQLAIENNIETLVCFGESMKMPFQNKIEVLKYQIDLLLANIKQFHKIKFAYEPKWAIGGNKQVSIDEIIKTIEIIKVYLFKKTKNEFKILYGGSVSNKNVKQILSNDVVDGVLIGSAALNVHNLIEILFENFKTENKVTLNDDKK